MEDMCTGCLSTGRKLFSIGDTEYYNIFSQIINEIPVFDLSALCVRMCWECRAHLRRFHRFKQRALSCLTDLLQQTTLHSASTLSWQPQHNFGYPEHLQHPPGHQNPEVVVKKEDIVKLSEHCELEPFAGSLTYPEHPQEPTEHPPVVVKTEDEVKWPEHCEPEPFADALSPERASDDDSDKPLKKKKKPKLKLKNNKIKVKKKRKKKSDVTDNIEHAVDKKDNVLDNKDHLQETIEKESDGDKRSVIEKEIQPGLVKTVREKPIKDKPAGATEGGERPQCPECGKVFSSKKTYRYHLNVLHKGQNRYPCPRCGKVYQWKSNLGRHMRTHKAVDDGELFCAVCDKTFASVATYRQHLRLSRSHVPEAAFSFACDECGKRFVNKTRLRDHVDWEHLNRIKFRCQLCDKPFKCHTSLYVHTQNVHVGKERKDNLCHVCGKSYQNAAKLKYHITAMHSGETPYRCAQCAAAFGWYSSLYRHTREVHYKMKGVGKKAKKMKQIEEPPQYTPL